VEILGYELVLERFGGSCNDDWPLRKTGWKEVGERLAGAGASLDDEMAPLSNRCSNCHHHLLLAFPALTTTGEAARDAIEQHPGLIESGLSVERFVTGPHTSTVVGEMVTNVPQSR